MPVKSNRAERLLPRKGNVWWFRRHMTAPVHRVIGGSPWILVSVGTDLAAAKVTRDELERLTDQQFAEVKAGKRLTLEIPGWSGSAPSIALPPADRGAITRAALEAAEDTDELQLIISAAEDEADRMKPTQRKAFEDAMAGRVEIERHLETYLSTVGLAPKTTNERRGLVMRFARWCADKGKTLDRVDRRLAGSYVSEALDTMHPATQGKHLSALRQYWVYLARRGHVTPPAGEAISSGWPWNEQKQERRGKRVERGAQKAEERPFTDAEVTTLLSSPFPLKDSWAPLMMDALRMSLLSGMRQAEVLTLWAGEVIEDGEGRLLFDIQQGKTDAAARKVPVHPDLEEIVKQRMKGKAANDMLFHELAGLPNPADTFGKRFKRWREALGVDDKMEGVRRSLVNFHSARRWFATKARHAGQPRETIAEVVGRKADKRDVTFGVYAKEASPAQRRACVGSVKLTSGTALRAAR